jgi:hypothetical protein
MNKPQNLTIKDAKTFGHSFSIYMKGQWKKLKPDLKYAFVKEIKLTRDMIVNGWVEEDNIYYSLFFDGREKHWVNSSVVGSFQVFHNNTAVVVVRKRKDHIPHKTEVYAIEGENHGHS